MRMKETEAQFVLVACFVLSLFNDGFAQNNALCSASRFSIQNGNSKLSIDSSNLQAEETVVWTVGPNGQEVEISKCPPLPANCTSPPSSQFVVTRTSNVSSQLIINGPFDINTGPQHVLCKATSGARTRTLYDKHLDVFVPGQSACDIGIREDQDVWSVRGQCTFNNTLSSLDCYFCTWFFQESKSKNIQKIPTEQTTVTRLPGGGTKHQNYICSFKADLPTKDGTYEYMVQAEHSQQRNSSSPQTIRHPATPMHNCPTFVLEKDSVQCMCNTSDPGLPQRKVRWTQGSGSQLSINNVQRSDNGRVFTCAAQQGPSVNYTLRVAYGPEKAYAALTSDQLLTCFPVNVNPTPQFVWTRRDTGQVLGREQTLDSDLLVQAEDWTVDCTVTNGDNRGSSALASINIDTTAGNITLAGRATADAEGDRMGLGIVIGCVIVLAVALTVTLILTLILRRRGWSLPCAGSADLSKLRRERESIHPLVNIEERTNEIEDNGPGGKAHTAGLDARAANERGCPEGASNYDNLDKTQPQVVSPYDGLCPSGSGAQEDDTGPLYENREAVQFDEAPVYANS